MEKLEELFYILVDPYEAPDRNDWRYTDAPITASVILQAVGDVAYRIRAFPPLSNLISSNVDLLMSWIRYFYWAKIRNVTDPIRLDRVDKQRLVKNLSTAILAVYHTHPNRKEHHPEVKANYDIISYLWLEEDIRYPMNANPYASELILTLLERVPEGHLDFVEALNMAAGGNSDRVADIAITKLRKAMKEAPDDVNPLLVHLINAIMLSFGRKHAISHSMHEHQIFTTFSKCMRHLARTTDDAEGSEFRIACDHYYRLMQRMILKDAKDPIRALRQCIRYGMLDGIAEILLQIHNGKKMEDTITIGLAYTFSLLNVALMNARVCVTISSAFERLPVTVFSVKTNNTPMWNVWRKYVDDLTVMNVFVKLDALCRSSERIVDPCFYVRPLSYLQIHNVVVLNFETVQKTGLDAFPKKMRRMQGCLLLFNSMPRK